MTAQDAWHSLASLCTHTGTYVHTWMCTLAYTQTPYMYEEPRLEVSPLLAKTSKLRCLACHTLVGSHSLLVLCWQCRQATPDVWLTCGDSDLLNSESPGVVIPESWCEVEITLSIEIEMARSGVHNIQPVIHGLALDLGLAWDWKGLCYLP